MAPTRRGTGKAGKILPRVRTIVGALNPDSYLMRGTLLILTLGPINYINEFSQPKINLSHSSLQ